MSSKRRRVEYPKPARETLPTMHDLPSEGKGDEGVPDEFHLHQPRLLDDTFRPPDFTNVEIFTASDLNLYYDVHHTKRFIRPDWFAVVGLPRKKPKEMRLSYVLWQEGVDPFLAVELLSPRTEKEDLGRALRAVGDGAEPMKWDVYERFLKVPYYVVFSRYTNELRIFELRGTRYFEVENHGGRFWMPDLNLGLGVWQGTYAGEERLWLRFFDKQGNWIPTPLEAEQAAREAERVAKEAERAAKEAERTAKEVERAAKEVERAAKEAERAAKEAALEKLAKLAAKLRELGVDPDEL